MAPRITPFKYKAMKTEEEHDRPKLEIEDRLKELDQQGQAAERSRKLGEEALKQWRLLKQKIKKKLKK